MPTISPKNTENEEPKKRCFISFSRSRVPLEVLDSIQTAAVNAGFQPFRFDQVLPQEARLDELMLGEVARADVVIADLTDARPTVMFEIGSAMSMGKSLIFVCNENEREGIPSYLGGYLILLYSITKAGRLKFELRLEKALTELRESPQRSRRLLASSAQPPFFVDWGKLERADAENLCRELLAQLGFQRTDWVKESKEIDMIAELPKKDPDGFEYRETWFVSTGRYRPVEFFLDTALMKPDYFVRHYLPHSEQSPEQDTISTTLLLILLDEKMDRFHLEDMEMRIGRRRKYRPEGAMRIRIWDRNYLTSLVHQFPNLGYKYFSDEGRAAAKYRKTPEELNRENVELAERLTITVRQLEDEKRLRVTAERDAIWKDVSFAAAHKLGNPIFAIETNLDPLERRIKEQRENEALDVMKGIRASIEKAKGIVEQFKSLARSQKMTLAAILIKPVIDESCRAMLDQGIEFSIVCDADIRVFADAEHLAECFDELIRNSLRWCKKWEVKIAISVTAPAPVHPPNLDAKSKYALIRFQDNGPGILIAEKERIFDAFYTTHDHGTGLGLALVRRIIEGHKGDIFEVGQPGRGVDFEIYLPLVDTGREELDADSGERK